MNIPQQHTSEVCDGRAALQASRDLNDNEEAAFGFLIGWMMGGSGRVSRGAGTRRGHSGNALA